MKKIDLDILKEIEPLGLTVDKVFEYLDWDALGTRLLGYLFDRILEGIDCGVFDIRLLECFVELFCSHSDDICDDYEFGHAYRDRIFSCFIDSLADGRVSLGEVYDAGKLLSRLNEVDFPEHYS